MLRQTERVVLHSIDMYKIAPALCRGKLVHLMADAALVGCLMSLHGALLLCQGMAFSVAMNSKRSHALVALLIASNFMEIKGANVHYPMSHYVYACF